MEWLRFYAFSIKKGIQYDENNQIPDQNHRWAALRWTKIGMKPSKHDKKTNIKGKKLKWQVKSPTELWQDDWMTTLAIGWKYIFCSRIYFREVLSFFLFFFCIYAMQVIFALFIAVLEIEYLIKLHLVYCRRSNIFSILESYSLIMLFNPLRSKKLSFKGLNLGE